MKRGSFALSIDGVEHVAGAGKRLAVPPGSTHRGRNAGDDEVQIIVAFEPKLDADALFERYWGACDAMRVDAHRCVAKLLYLTCELESRTYDANIPRRVQEVARRVACAIKRLLHAD